MCDTYTNLQTQEILNMELVDELKDNAVLKVKPELWIEWDFEKNNEIGLDIYKVTKGMEKDAWWICLKCKSSYDSKIYGRVASRGCSYCRGFKINHTNSLYTKRPDIAILWCKKNNGELTPHDVTCGSKEKVWWYCEKCKESYFMPINKKTSGRGCSICSGYCVTKKSSFGGKFPELAKEWHPTKNGDLTPHDVSYGSGIKAWWKCSHCHSDYQMTIDKKTAKDANHSSCSVCSNGISLGERIVFEFLRHLNVDFTREKSFDWSDSKRYDFYIPHIKCILEVHGEQHYNGSFSRAGGRTLKEEQENDKYKEELAIENGIEHYIIIKSLNYDIQQIMQDINNHLVPILNTEVVKIEDIRQFSMSNIMSEVWNLYNKGMNDKEIADLVLLHRKTVYRYLKLGNELKQCEYPRNKRAV